MVLRSMGAEPIDRASKTTAAQAVLLLTARAPEGIWPTDADAPRTQARRDETRQSAVREGTREQEARSPRYGERHA